MDQDEEVSIPSIDEFSTEYLYDLKEYINLDRRTRTSHRGDVDYLWVGLKSTLPSKAKWIEKDKVREIFPHLYVKWWNILVVQKDLNGKLWSKKEPKKTKDKS